MARKSKATAVVNADAARVPATREATAARAEVYAEMADAENTRRAYRTDLEDFRAYCAENEYCDLPAEPATLALYVTDRADPEGDSEMGLKVSTLQRRISAIATLHRRAGFPSPSNHPDFQRVWKGIRNTKGTASDGAQPATADEMRAMLATLDRKSPSGCRDAAILLVGWWGAFRRSELAALDFEDVVEAREGLRVTLRRSKTDQEGEGVERALTRLSGDKADVCPFQAFKDWATTAGATAGPLFLRIKPGRKPRRGEPGAPEEILAARLSDRAISEIVKRAAKAAGLDAERFSGHSLRAGIATQAAADGAPERAIMKAGGWKSTATVRRYIRHGELFKETLSDWVSICV